MTNRLPAGATAWGHSEDEEVPDGEVMVPVSAVLAALIRAFGRETVVAWVQQAQLDPVDQGECVACRERGSGRGPAPWEWTYALNLRMCDDLMKQGYLRGEWSWVGEVKIWPMARACRKCRWDGRSSGEVEP